MLRRSKKQLMTRDKKAQSILEYSMILGIGAMVLFTMGPFIQRGIQGMIKVTADQIGVQENGDQAFDGQGQMDLSTIDSSVSVKKDYREHLGVIHYEYDDTIVVGTESFINMGYQEGRK